MVALTQLVRENPLLYSESIICILSFWIFASVIVLHAYTLS